MEKILLDFIEKTGKNKEFEQFIKHYDKFSKSKFAVIKISGKSLDLHLDEFAEKISYLNKINLYPLIVHGAGSKLDSVLVNSKKINGLRVTNKDDIPIIQKALNEIGNHLVSSINKKGGNAVLFEDYLECEFLNKDIYGYVGKCNEINENIKSKLKNLMENKISPILSSVGMTKFGEILNINADNIAQTVLTGTQASKMIFLTEVGGILDKENKIIPFLNLGNNIDYDFIDGGMKVKLNEIKDILNKNIDSSAVITSVQNLFKEIFTIKGAGTYIKNHIILQTNSYDNLDKSKIKELLENSFSKTLKSNFFNKDILELFYQPDYDAIAIMKNLKDAKYLCKYSVKEIRKGTGLGKSLWNKVVENYPNFYLRSNKQNPINDFYYNQSDGMIKTEKWIIFWKGKMEEKKLFSIIKEINELEESFEIKNQ